MSVHYHHGNVTMSASELNQLLEYVGCANRKATAAAMITMSYPEREAYSDDAAENLENSFDLQQVGKFADVFEYLMSHQR